MMVDNMIAFRVLLKLVTPFSDTQAHKLGIIDADGKLLRKLNTLNTAEERDAYNFLNRLVFNLKRIIGKLPGGTHNLKNLAAAYFLVKESAASGYTGAATEARMRRLCRITLAEEEVVGLFASRMLEDAPANSTGAAVATDEPVIRPRRKLMRKGLPCDAS